MASAEAFKRLKPAPKPQPARTATKADRRQDGQHRRNRNDGQQRHPHRGEGQSAHRSEARDRNGQRRDGQRNDGARSSYRPEAYREALPERRPDGARPRPKFRGRRGRGGARAA
jgi:ATP-dependent RNA helicase RhlE